MAEWHGADAVSRSEGSRARGTLTEDQTWRDRPMRSSFYETRNAPGSKCRATIENNFTKHPPRFHSLSIRRINEGQSELLDSVGVLFVPTIYDPSGLQVHRPQYNKSNLSHTASPSDHCSCRVHLPAKPCARRILWSIATATP